MAESQKLNEFFLFRSFKKYKEVPNIPSMKALKKFKETFNLEDHFDDLVEVKKLLGMNNIYNIDLLSETSIHLIGTSTIGKKSQVINIETLETKFENYDVRGRQVLTADIRNVLSYMGLNIYMTQGGKISLQRANFPPAQLKQRYKQFYCNCNCNSYRSQM